MKKYLQEAFNFYNKNALQYMEKTINLQDISWLERFCSYLKSGSRILDVGCGFGRDCRFFVERGFDVYGIDISPKMIELAKEYEPNARYFVMDTESLQFSDYFFDALWCSAVLYHFKKSDLYQVLRELRRVMQQDGLIYLNLKEGKGQRFVKDERYGKEKKLNALYTEKEIKEILYKEKFKLVDFEINVEPEDKYKNTGIIYIVARKFIN